MATVVLDIRLAASVCELNVAELLSHGAHMQCDLFGDDGFICRDCDFDTPVILQNLGPLASIQDACMHHAHGKSYFLAGELS